MDDGKTDQPDSHGWSMSSFPLRSLLETPNKKMEKEVSEGDFQNTISQDADIREIDFRDIDFRDADFRVIDSRCTDFRDDDFREAGNSELFCRRQPMLSHSLGSPRGVCPMGYPTGSIRGWFHPSAPRCALRLNTLHPGFTPLVPPNGSPGLKPPERGVVG